MTNYNNELDDFENISMNQTIVTHHIFLVEDEPNIASFIKRGLEVKGYRVTVSNNGTEAWEILKAATFDLLILDIILPGLTGLEICHRFRDKYGYATPIIMLTALGTTDDIVKGLDAGADDYLPKPFQFRELEARVMALLRKTASHDAKQEILRFSDLELNLETKQASRNGVSIILTAKEYKLLEFLMHNNGRVLSRMTILENVWDLNFDTNTNVVDVYINYLRNKIDKDQELKLIHTVIGLGYVMRELA